MTNAPTKDWVERLLDRLASKQLEIVASEHSEVEVDRDGDTLCKCGTWFLHIHPGSFEKHVEAELLATLRAKLLPLLLAGQAMRFTQRDCCATGKCTHEECITARAWDAAVKAASESR